MTAPTYTIDFTDIAVDPTKKKFSIVPGELNTTATPLKLPGAGYAPYGEPIIENLVHILENWASATAPLNPTIGQLWFDTSVKVLKILLSITTVGTTLQYNWGVVANNAFVSPTPPTDLDRLWYDTTAANPTDHTLKIYNTFSSQWQPVVPGAMVVRTTPPTATSSLWYNISNASPTLHELYAFNPTAEAWQPAASHQASLILGPILDANLTTSNIGGNAATATLAAAATKLATGRTISLGGGATGSVVFDGSANVTLNVTGLNASTLNSGTVPVEHLGAAGTRTGAYYLAGNNVWTQFPYIPNAYTKPETDALVNARVLRDSITYAGFAGNNTTLPYFRRESDGGVYYLQPRLGYTPAPAATTLAGYGITDAYTKAQVNALIPPAVSFPAVLGVAGWSKFPNGLTLQWGRGPALGDDSAVYIGLWIAGSILNVQVTGVGVYSDGRGPSFLTDDWSSTAFRVSNNFNSGPLREFSWFAITAT